MKTAKEIRMALSNNKALLAEELLSELAKEDIQTRISVLEWTLEETVGEMRNMDKGKEESKIHELWWDFQDYMEKWYCTEIFGKKTFDANKMVGYDAIAHVEEYVKDHPQIKLVYCDDWMHTTSLLVLIPHRDEERYWGTSVVYVPQSKGYNNLMFLYPEHLMQLRKALKEIQGERRSMKW